MPFFRLFFRIQIEFMGPILDKVLNSLVKRRLPIIKIHEEMADILPVGTCTNVLK